MIGYIDSKEMTNMTEYWLSIFLLDKCDKNMMFN